MPESRVFDLYVFGASPQKEGLPSSPPRPVDTGVTVLHECGRGIVFFGDLSMFVQPSLQPSTHSSLHHPGWARHIPMPRSLRPLPLNVAARFHSTTFSAGGELDPRSGQKSQIPVGELLSSPRFWDRARHIPLTQFQGGRRSPNPMLTQHPPPPDPKCSLPHLR